MGKKTLGERRREESVGRMTGRKMCIYYRKSEDICAYSRCGLLSAVPSSSSCIYTCLASHRSVKNVSVELCWTRWVVDRLHTNAVLFRFQVRLIDVSRKWRKESKHSRIFGRKSTMRPTVIRRWVFIVAVELNCIFINFRCHFQTFCRRNMRPILRKKSRSFNDFATKSSRGSHRLRLKTRPCSAIIEGS